MLPSRGGVGGCIVQEASHKVLSQWLNLKFVRTLNPRNERHNALYHSCKEAVRESHVIFVSFEVSPYEPTQLISTHTSPSAAHLRLSVNHPSQITVYINEKVAVVSNDWTLFCLTIEEQLNIRVIKGRPLIRKGSAASED
jgi:hypothetical protein